jgi:hypothetical protein
MGRSKSAQICSDADRSPPGDDLLSLLSNGSWSITINSVSEPHRVIIEADYCADGIWLVTTKEELAATTYEEWSRVTTALYGQPGPPTAQRPWGDLLSDQLLDDLKAWNRSWDGCGGLWESAEADRAWHEQGRELAIRVQDQLGTNGWEVLYRWGERVHRVHPPGSWPADTWEQELLGYPPRGRRKQQR